MSVKVLSAILKNGALELFRHAYLNLITVVNISIKRMVYQGVFRVTG